ncbi:HGxxPAAW family protein [Cellulomonas hominis]
MAQQSVETRAAGTVTQHLPHTETLRLPPSAPPTNHGHTTAAWTTTIVVLAGATIAALGVVFAVVWIFVVGMVVAVAGPVAGKMLQLLGHGQGGAATLAKQARARAH